jgi:hypothetical protein
LFMRAEQPRCFLKRKNYKRLRNTTRNAPWKGLTIIR